MLIATTQGDENYNSVSSSRWITINKATPELAILSADKLNVDEMMRLRLASSATAGLGGGIDVSIIAKGSASATINSRTGWLTAISAGTITLHVISMGDDDWAW